MCTVVIYRSKDSNQEFPIIIAATRDENITRPWLPPNRHWPNANTIIAGFDVLSGGSWIGVNKNGIFACCLDQEHTLLSHDDFQDASNNINFVDGQKLSRGKLVLDILNKFSLDDILSYLQTVEPNSYRKFYILFGDHKNAYLICNGENKLLRSEIQHGVSMITSLGLNEAINCPRTNIFLEKFRAAELPNPRLNAWKSWTDLLSAKTEWGNNDRINIYSGITVTPDHLHNFGTVSSSLMAISNDTKKNVFYFAGGIPGENEYVDCLM